jgi:6-phosphogluconolactonase
MMLPLVLICLPFSFLNADQGDSSKTASAKVPMYIGTYTRGDSDGIYLAEFDLKNGAMEMKGLAVEADNPAFLAFHPEKPLVYSVGEMGQYLGKPAGSVNAYRIDPETRLLREINRESSIGAGPTHLSIAPDGAHVLVANYGGGSVTVLPIRDDGGLDSPSDFHQHEGSGPNEKRQRAPHAHAIDPGPFGKLVLVPDLGIDRVMLYRFLHDRGTLAPADPPSVPLAPGAGPRHQALSPDGKYLYVINELDSTISVFRYFSDGSAPKLFQTISTLPRDFEEPNTTAEVQVHPSGKFVYGSNRGHHSIAVFRVDPESGVLRFVEHESTRGQWPRFFCLDPHGGFLLAANQHTDDIHSFRIHPETGRLEPTGHALKVPAPSCIIMRLSNNRK